MASWNQKKTSDQLQILIDPNLCQRPSFLQHYYHFVVFYHLMCWRTPSEITLTVYWKAIEMYCFQTFLLLILLHHFSRIHPISFQYYQTKRLSLQVLLLLLLMLICRTSCFYIQYPKMITWKMRVITIYGDEREMIVIYVSTRELQWQSNEADEGQMSS